MAAKEIQSVPPILAPEAWTLTGPQETSTHGRKKQIAATAAPAGVRIYLSGFNEGILFFIPRANIVGANGDFQPKTPLGWGRGLALLMTKQLMILLSKGIMGV